MSYKKSKKKLRALLVEDSKDNQKVAKGFDLVLMDGRMPVMNGLEATRIIRYSGSDILQHDIPIIAMTAYALK